MVARSCLIFLLVLSTHGAFASSRSADDSGTTILCYHVVESPNDTRFAITREAFRQQMEYLVASGYTVIPLADLQQYIAGKKESLPKNSVVITVDDGWRCTYTEIYPEIRRHRFPFTVFVYPKFIGKSAYALTWDQVREMADEGVDIQSHTLSHAYLTHRHNPGLDQKDYGDWLENELCASKKVIEEEVGREVSFLAYPYGEYDSMVAASASKAGYTAALTCDYGRVQKGSDPLRMKRVIVDNTTSFASFRKSLGAGTMMLTERTPASGKTIDPAAPIISARLPEFLSIDPSSVGMAVISQGPTPFSYDPRDGTISMVVRESLLGRLQRVVVWGTKNDGGRRVEASWEFYASPPQAGATRQKPQSSPQQTAGKSERAPAGELTSPRRAGMPQRK